MLNIDFVESSVDVLQEHLKTRKLLSNGYFIKPIVTEKMTSQGEKFNRYGFIVDRECKQNTD